MCVFKAKKKVVEQLAAASAPPPAPTPVADELAIDPKKKRQSRSSMARSGRSSLVVQRNIGGVASGSGLNIGGGA
ncbi:MAG: hypothetical protein A2882_16305 [Phenylobacterium sp. RIFCSPHIGHO2_01_FULL_70_10]|nr:MAG: hypothetical protein A2882_16305 [Phenylobacterium sp. RIFCSPHIGHO2_01_FULL_70_10]